MDANRASEAPETGLSGSKLSRLVVVVGEVGGVGWHGMGRAVRRGGSHVGHHTLVVIRCAFMTVYRVGGVVWDLDFWAGRWTHEAMLFWLLGWSAQRTVGPQQSVT